MDGAGCIGNGHGTTTRVTLHRRVAGGIAPETFPEAALFSAPATYIHQSPQSAGFVPVFVLSALPGIPGYYNDDGTGMRPDYIVWRDMLSKSGRGLDADGKRQQSNRLRAITTSGASTSAKSPAELGGNFECCRAEADELIAGNFGCRGRAYTAKLIAPGQSQNSLGRVTRQQRTVYGTCGEVRIANDAGGHDSRITLPHGSSAS